MTAENTPVAQQTSRSPSSAPMVADYPDSAPNCQSVHLNQNMELRFMDMQKVAPATMLFAIEPEPPLELEFHLAGYGECEMIYSQSQKETLQGRPGIVFLSYNPEVNCRVLLPSQPRFKTVNLYYKPSLIRSLFAETPENLPREIHTLVNGKKATPFNICRPIPGPSWQVLQQIFSCPYPGELGKLYWENKALELLLLQFGELTSSPVLQAERFACPPMMDALHEARDILRTEMENPPGISELARRVGICETYLKQGFRRVFNVTIHGCLMDFRLEQARELLCQEKDTDLSRIACRLGFYDAAHFTRHFKKRFGVSPGIYARHSQK